MLPDRVSNPGPLTYESGVLPIALRGPAFLLVKSTMLYLTRNSWPSYSGVGHFHVNV